jgi:hypothetical protein
MTRTNLNAAAGEKIYDSIMLKRKLGIFIASLSEGT